MIKLFEDIKLKWGQIDFVVHAVAFSDKSELSGEYLNTEFFVTKCIPPPSNSARQLQSWPPNVNNSFCAVSSIIPPYEIN